ncbi:MAG TPA: ATP-binding protein [Anaeromyxobacter sp.]|nr:ATP-binding protein [Anaeromyxobacter sp.]
MDLPFRPRARRLLDYLLAAVLAGAAVLLRKLLPFEPGVGLYPLPLSAIIVSAWRGGRGPGLLATLISGAGIVFWLVPPVHALRVDPDSRMGFAIFLAVAILAIEFSMARRRAEARAVLERERLRQVQAELERFDRVSTMGELAGSLAHEIRQPIAAALTNARTCLRWLDRPEPDLAEARAAAGRAADDATRAAEIVTRVRSLFQRAVPRRERTDVNAVVEEIVSVLGGEARRQSISIRTEAGADLPPVTADRIQLQQVLMNLISNAIDAMRAAAPPRQLTISTREEGSACLISVADTGPGLPPEQADRIFQPFFTTKAHGTGMGLAISRSIVESHGGKLWAEPGRGGGAVFQFTLPIAGEGDR